MTHTLNSGQAFLHFTVFFMNFQSLHFTEKWHPFFCKIEENPCPKLTD